MKTLLSLLTAFYVCGIAKPSSGLSCHYPGSPRHGKLSKWVAGFPNNSFAEFSCSRGYFLLGPKTVHCSGGRWNKGTPFCVRDVARGKPVNQSEPVTTDFSSGLVVDGNDLTCTKPANHWSVSLFERSKISTVKLVFGDDLPQGSVSVRLGDEPTTGANSSTGELCAELDLEIRKNHAYFAKCDTRLSPGRFISVHVDPQGGPVPLCVIEAHTSSGLSHEDACPQGYNDTIKDAFNGTCLEFHYIAKASLGDARSICSKTDGRLIGGAHIDDHTLSYLRWRTEKVFDGSPFWLDVNATEAAKFLNASDSVDESGTGACYVVSSKNGVARSECQSLSHVICAYNVVTCGRPHLPKAFHGWQVIDKLKTGRTLKNIRCSEGYYPEADDYLACDTKGKISGSVRCRNFTCGKQPVVDGATSWAVSNDSVEYTCSVGKSIKGDSRVVCSGETLQWSKPPVCRTMLQAVSDLIRSTKNVIEDDIDEEYKKFREFPKFTQIALLVGAVILTALVLLAVAHRVHVMRSRKGFEGALRLTNSGDPPPVAVAATDAH